MALSKKGKEAAKKVVCPDKEGMACAGCRAGHSCLAG